GRSTDHVGYCESLLGQCPPDDLNPPPILTGHDLMNHGLQPGPLFKRLLDAVREAPDRKSTRLNSSHITISSAVFCLKTKSVGQFLAAQDVTPELAVASNARRARQ